MRNMKKVMALVLAMVLVLSMSLTAFASESGVEGGAKGTITINNATVGDTYQGYQIFKADVALNDGVATSIVYTWGGTGTMPANDYFKADDNGYITATDAAKAEKGGLSAEAIAVLRSWVESTDPSYGFKTTDAVKAESETVVFNGLDYGYWYFTSTVGSAVTIDSTNPNATVDDKNEAPSVDKDITAVNGDKSKGYDNETNPNGAPSANIGDVIEYTVTIKAQKGAENYIFHDELSAGLTLDATKKPVITAGGRQLTEGVEYTLTKFENVTKDGEDDIIITFNKTFLDTITGETEITFTYYATLNENAVIGGDGNPNKAHLQYGHTPDSDTTPGHDTPPDTPKVYTYSFDLVKDTNDKTVLAGAEFKLWADNEKTTEIKVKKVSDGEYRVMGEDEEGDGDVIVAGQVTIKGLENGTYYLEETKAPTGYNKVDDLIEVTINNGNNSATVNGNTYQSGGVEVINQAGSTLPSTGGIGTTLFYVIGGLLVVVAGVLLITRKRMEKEN